MAKRYTSSRSMIYIDVFEPATAKWNGHHSRERHIGRHGQRWRPRMTISRGQCWPCWAVAAYLMTDTLLWGWTIGLVVGQRLRLGGCLLSVQAAASDSTIISIRSLIRSTRDQAPRCSFMTRRRYSRGGSPSCSSTSKSTGQPHSSIQSDHSAVEHGILHNILDEARKLVSSPHTSWISDHLPVDSST